MLAPEMPDAHTLHPGSPPDWTGTGMSEHGGFSQGT